MAIFIGAFLFKLPVSYALTFLFAIVAFFLVLRDIKYGIACFIVVSIFPQVQSREMFGIVGLNAQNIIFIVVVVSYFLPRMLKKVEPEEYGLPILKWIILLFILQFISVLRIISEKGYLYEFYFQNNMNTFNSMFFKPLEYYFVLYILYKSIKKERDIKFFLFIFYVGALIGTFVLFWQYVILRYDSYSEQMWRNLFAGHKNYFAITMAILCLLSISFFLNIKDRRIKLFTLAGAIFSFIVLAYSMSRNAWAGFLIGLFYIVYKMRAKKVFVPVFLLLIIILFTPLSNIVTKRATKNIETGNIDLILAGRIETVWTAQIEAIKKNPIIGGGMVGLLGHNGYLSVWNKIGIFGLIITIIIFYKMFKMFLDAYKCSSSQGFERAFSLAGLSCVFMVPFINIAGSLQLIKLLDLSSISLIIFIYLSSYKLLNWKIRNMKEFKI